MQTEAWEGVSQQGDLGEARKGWDVGTGLGFPGIAFLAKEKNVHPGKGANVQREESHSMLARSMFWF